MRFTKPSFSVTGERAPTHGNPSEPGPRRLKDLFRGRRGSGRSPRITIRTQGTKRTGSRQLEDLARGTPRVGTLGLPVPVLPYSQGALLALYIIFLVPPSAAERPTTRMSTRNSMALRRTPAEPYFTEIIFGDNRCE